MKFFYPGGRLVNALKSHELCLFPEGIRLEKCDKFYDTLYYYLTIDGDTLNHTIYHRGNNPTWFQDFGFYDGYAIITMGGKAGFIDRKGKIVVPCKYDQVWKMQGGLSNVTSVKKFKDGSTSEKRLGWVDLHGTEYWEDGP